MESMARAGLHSICRLAPDPIFLRSSRTAAPASMPSRRSKQHADDVEWLTRSSDYKDDGTNILLDANENAYGPGLVLSKDGKLVDGAAPSDATKLDLKGLNRYPDPHQVDLKQQLCALRNTHAHTSKDLTAANLFVGVGSDEAIDALIRCFVTPGREKLLTCPPTYGMYSVSAQVNDVEVATVPLASNPATPADFDLQPQLINEKLSQDPTIKLMYICSPGNPTAKCIKKQHVQQILEHPTWNGVVVVDEAYIDFAPEDASLAEWVTEWPNLVVMQTLSKAFGLAGIRLGAAFASPEVAQLLNNFKAPYNISSITSQLASHALEPSNLAVMREHRTNIVKQRERLVAELPNIPGIGRFRGSFDANFVLVEMLDKPSGRPCNETALQVYESLAEHKGVVVRFRGKELNCPGCLRVTVGTETEVTRFLDELKALLDEIYRGKGIEAGTGAQEKEMKEREASAIVA